LWVHLEARHYSLILNLLSNEVKIIKSYVHNCIQMSVDMYQCKQHLVSAYYINKTIITIISSSQHITKCGITIQQRHETCAISGTSSLLIVVHNDTQSR